MATDLQKENRNFIKKYSKPVIYGTFGTTLFPSVKMAQSLFREQLWQSYIKECKKSF